MKTLQAGDAVPQFTLNDQNNRPVSLAQFKGRKVLIYFYPKALTPGCTTQACGLRDAKNELEKLGVVILGISPDSPKKLAQFADKKDLNFTLLADEDHKWRNNSVYGARKNLWAKLMTVFIVLAFCLMRAVKFSMFSINLKPASIIK